MTDKRDQALAEGAATYMTDTPCSRGHVAPRFTRNRMCTVCCAKGLRPSAPRQEATLFTTGKPCRKGHDAPRYLSTGACTACMRDHSRNNYVKAKDLRLIRLLVKPGTTVVFTTTTWFSKDLGVPLLGTFDLNGNPVPAVNPIFGGFARFQSLPGQPERAILKSLGCIPIDEYVRNK